MDAFQRRPCHQGLRTPNAKQIGRLDDQERAEALSCSEARIAHGVEQARRPCEFIAYRLGRQQPIEDNLGIFGDLV
jgi:hypothetical protein